MNTVSSSKSYPQRCHVSPPINLKKKTSHYTQHIDISRNHKILKISLIALAIMTISFATMAIVVLTGQLPHVFQQLGSFSAYSYLGLSILSSALFSYTAYYLTTSKGIIDRYRLLQGPKTIDHSQQAWHLNAALLKECYDQTDDPELKAEISFLINNYLSKIAPLPSHHKFISWLLEEDYNDVTQTNPHLQTGHYHRGDCKRPPSAEIRKLNRHYALGSDDTLILTDTDQCQALFPLHYHVINFELSQQSDLENQLYTIFQNHFSKYENNLSEGINHKLEKLIIFDTTEYFRNCIKTDNESKKSTFKIQYQSYARAIEHAINRVATQLYLQNSEAKKIIKFIKENTLSLSRIKIDKIGAIKALPLFINFKNDSTQRWSKFLTFIDNSGLYIGAVNYRKYILHDIDKLKNIQYVPRGQNTVYFDKPSDLFEKNIFKSLESAIAEHHRPKYVSILGGAFLESVKGLFNHVCEKTWKERMQQPQKQAIIQTSLFKIHDLLTSARLFINNYNKFTQTIELLNCELVTLLSLISPFEEKDFSIIYKDLLERTLPKEMSQYVHCGLGKSSMNIFAGLVNTIDHSTQSAVKVYNSHNYYEVKDLLGQDCAYETVREQSNVPIDLYAGILNPNITPNPEHKVYTQVDLSSDIRQILQRNGTKPLMVAIDNTIDLINSSKVSDLLKEFKDEIAKGRLGFFIFRSGQKFDMLGNDHLFGTAFYFVHNNSQHWQCYQSLFTDESHKTDSLSMQWFCLAYKYASEQINAYCTQIFNNTKTILSQVSNKLKPRDITKQSVRISAIDDRFDPAFIDVKLTGSLHRLRAIYHLVRFYNLYSRDFKVLSRASFGFWHTNININYTVGTCSTLRINPGLDENANQLIIDYLNGF